MTTTTGTTTGARPGDPPAGGSIPPDTFGTRLVLARMHAGYMTVKDAADRCGINYGSWSNWERGKKPRDLLEAVKRISAGLGVDRNWLLFGGPLSGADENQRLWPGEGVRSSSWLRSSTPRARSATILGRVDHGQPGREAWLNAA
jgi:transcriptional regulator with XRE-family HTH domain